MFARFMLRLVLLIVLMLMSNDIVDCYVANCALLLSLLLLLLVLIWLMFVL